MTDMEISHKKGEQRPRIGEMPEEHFSHPITSLGRAGFVEVYYSRRECWWFDNARESFFPERFYEIAVEGNVWLGAGAFVEAYAAALEKYEVGPCDFSTLPQRGSIGWDVYLNQGVGDLSFAITPGETALNDYERSEQDRFPHPDSILPFVQFVVDWASSRA